MKKNIYILLASIFLSTNAFGQAYFPEVSAQLGVQHVAVFSDSIYTPQGGAAWFDFNNDHNLDLYLTGGANPDALYKNNGDGTFTDVTISAGVDVLSASNTMGVVSGDIDNDGYNDLFITTVSSDQNFLLYNNGDGTFTDISMDAGVSGGGNSSSAAFGDYNLDGLLDLYVVNWCVDIYFPFDTSDTFPTIQNYFYINNGDLTFTESSKALGVDVEGGCSLGVLFTDYDNDYDLDLLIANDFGYLNGNSENRLFENDYPNDQFIDVSQASAFDYGIDGMGTARGDYDEDGDLDYYISDVGNDLLLRNDNDSFSNQLLNAGLENDTVGYLGYNGTTDGFGWGCGFFDYNHDTYLDLFVANGSITWWGQGYPTLDSNKLFLNNGDGTFKDISTDVGLGDPYTSRAFASGDYDNDGDMDLLVGITDVPNGQRHTMIYENKFSDGNWLKVSLEGTLSNRNGYGSRVEVIFNNRKLIREVDGGSSFNSHHSSIVHFGLSEITDIDTLRVIWPGGMVIDEYYDVATNQHINIVQESSYSQISSADYQDTLKESFVVYPNPTNTDMIMVKYMSMRPHEEITMKLLDVYGRTLKVFFRKKELNSGTTEKLSLPNHLAAGIYYLKIEYDQSHVVKVLSLVD